MLPRWEGDSKVYHLSWNTWNQQRTLRWEMELELWKRFLWRKQWEENRDFLIKEILCNAAKSTCMFCTCVCFILCVSTIISVRDVLDVMGRGHMQEEQLDCVIGLRATNMRRNCPTKEDAFLMGGFLEQMRWWYSPSDRLERQQKANISSTLEQRIMSWWRTLYSQT